MGLLCVALLCSQVISSQNDNTHVTFAVFVFGGMCLWFWAKQATNSLQCFTLHCCVRLKAGCVSGSCSMSSKWPPGVPSQQLLQFLTRQTHRTHFYMIFQLTLRLSGIFGIQWLFSSIFCICPTSKGRETTTKKWSGWPLFVFSLFTGHTNGLLVLIKYFVTLSV